MCKIDFQQKNRLSECIQDTINLNQKMVDCLVDIIKSVNEENKLIRVDKRTNTQGVFRSQIYAYVFDMGLEQVTEELVSAIAVFEDNDVGVLLCGGEISLDSLTDEEILELDDWYTIVGGNLICNATLYNICENIDEYIVDDTTIKSIVVYGIDWDIEWEDEQDVNLPSKTMIEVEEKYLDDPNYIADKLSDEHGFCVKSFEKIEIIK